MELQSAATKVNSKVESGYLQVKLFGNTKEVLTYFYFFYFFCESAVVTLTAG